MQQVEPIVATIDDVLETISHHWVGEIGPSKRSDRATLQALAQAGFRVVYACNVCAEPQGARIPACPNVAAVEMNVSRGRTMFGGPLRICLPHSRNEKVFAPDRKDSVMTKKTKVKNKTASKASKTAKTPKGKQRKCSVCGGKGHNSRSHG